MHFQNFLKTPDKWISKELLQFPAGLKFCFPLKKKILIYMLIFKIVLNFLTNWNASLTIYYF